MTDSYGINLVNTKISHSFMNLDHRRSEPRTSCLALATVVARHRACRLQNPGMWRFAFGATSAQRRVTPQRDKGSHKDDDRKPFPALVGIVGYCSSGSQRYPGCPIYEPIRCTLCLPDTYKSSVHSALQVVALARHLYGPPRAPRTTAQAG